EEYHGTLIEILSSEAGEYPPCTKSFYSRLINRPRKQPLQRARSAEQFFTDLGLTRSIHPDIDWHAKSLFVFCSYRGRKPACCNCPQDTLALPPAHFERVRQREAKREKVLIQQRDADLETLSHACQINFKEKIIRQNETDVHFRGLRRQTLNPRE